MSHDDPRIVRKLPTPTFSVMGGNYTLEAYAVPPAFLLLALKNHTGFIVADWAGDPLAVQKLRDNLTQWLEGNKADEQTQGIPGKPPQTHY